MNWSVRAACRRSPERSSRARCTCWNAPTAGLAASRGGHAAAAGTWSSRSRQGPGGACRPATGSLWSLPARLQPVRAPDDLEHDLVRARADAVEAQVAPGALDPVLLHVAGAAVDLQALVGDLDGDPRGVELGDRDVAHRVLAVLHAPGGVVDEVARGFDLHRHLGELVPCDLELRDRTAEGGALVGVLERLLEQPLGAGYRARRADQPLALELPHDVVEALADLAEDRGVGDADVLEGEQRGV